jgi:hypothetical protein
MTYYKSGDWNITCDVCSKKIKASESRKRWDGFIVCRDDYEERQPQDFVRARLDRITVPYTRPIPPYIFNGPNYILYWESRYTVEGYVIGDNI